MLLAPRNFKYKKMQKGKTANKLNYNLKFKQLRCNYIKIISLNSARLTGKQLQTIHSLLLKALKKLGFVQFKVFPHLSVTKKPLEIRMGKGKGNVNHWVSKIKIGTILCFLKTNQIFKILKCFQKVKARLPILIKILY